MRIPHMIIGTMAAGLLALGVVTAQSRATAPSLLAVAASSQKAELRTTMRALWEDHAAFTRNSVISIVAGLPDVDAVSARLMKNQEDIASALKPYYGADAVTKLTALLKDRVSTGIQVVKYAKSGDKTRFNLAQKKWSDNGQQIAALLSAANPNWDKATIAQMLQKQLDLTLAEATS